MVCLDERRPVSSRFFSHLSRLQKARGGAGVAKGEAHGVAQGWRRVAQEQIKVSAGVAHGVAKGWCRGGAGVRRGGAGVAPG